MNNTVMSRIICDERPIKIGTPAWFVARWIARSFVAAGHYWRYDSGTSYAGAVSALPKDAKKRENAIGNMVVAMQYNGGMMYSAYAQLRSLQRSVRIAEQVYDRVFNISAFVEEPVTDELKARQEAVTVRLTVDELPVED